MKSPLMSKLGDSNSREESSPRSLSAAYKHPRRLLPFWRDGWTDHLPKANLDPNRDIESLASTGLKTSYFYKKSFDKAQQLIINVTHSQLSRY